MTTRKCYQCGDDDLAAIQKARKIQLNEHRLRLLEAERQAEKGDTIHLMDALAATQPQEDTPRKAVTKKEVEQTVDSPKDSEKRSEVEADKPVKRTSSDK